MLVIEPQNKPSPVSFILDFVMPSVNPTNAQLIKIM